MVVSVLLFLLALASATSLIFPTSIFATRPKGRCVVAIFPGTLNYILPLPLRYGCISGMEMGNPPKPLKLLTCLNQLILRY